MSVPSATSVLIGRPPRQAFRDDVLDGLAQTPKRLPCKYFYDQRGSMLFDAICEQPEYYLSRTEQELMQRHSREMAGELGQGVVLIEFGSGTSSKTRHLLQHLPRPAAYVPVDISREHLLSTAGRLRVDFPQLEIHPVCADFTGEFDVPPTGLAAPRRVVYFPGSTIGNFEPTSAMRLLNRIGRLCGPDGGLLIGIDLVKDPDTIERAYNDTAGVNAEFNLNLLLRINHELGANFDIDQFEHLAFYDRRFQRMDLRLVSKRAQEVQIDGTIIGFQTGEPIHTEYSHKYTVDRFARLASEAGWKLHNWWTDDHHNFGVLYFKLIVDS